MQCGSCNSRFARLARPNHKESQGTGRNLGELAPLLLYLLP